MPRLQLSTLLSVLLTATTLPLPLSVAFVSGLNERHFCQGHTLSALAWEREQRRWEKEMEEEEQRKKWAGRLYSENGDIVTRSAVWTKSWKWARRRGAKSMITKIMEGKDTSRRRMERQEGKKRGCGWGSRNKCLDTSFSGTELSIRGCSQRDVTGAVAIFSLGKREWKQLPYMWWKL